MWTNFFPRIWVTITENWRTLLDGLQTTLIITGVAFVGGLIVGTIIAVLRTNPSRHPVARAARAVSSFYVGLMRGIPDVVLLLLLFFVFLAPFVTADNAIWVACLGTGMIASSYLSEIVRAAILSIGSEQMEASRDLGTTRFGAMRRVILPQGFKRAVPQLGNHLIIIAKGTSVVGFIAVMDLTRSVQNIVARTFDAIVPYILLAGIYIVYVYFLALLIKFFEVKVFKTKRAI